MHHTLIFWSYAWGCIVHYLIFFVSNISSDTLVTFSIWNGKIFFLGGCLAGCHYLCNVIHHLCRCITCLLRMILSWRTTLRYNYHDCWTCIQAELYLNVAICLHFCFYYYLSHTPNPSWFRENLFWFIQISSHYHLSQWKIMWLATTFTWCKGSTRKDGTQIFSSSFPLDDFKILYQAPLDEYLSTDNIVLSPFLMMTSMIEHQCGMNLKPFSLLHQPP